MQFYIIFKKMVLKLGYASAFFQTKELLKSPYPTSNTGGQKNKGTKQLRELGMLNYL